MAMIELTNMEASITIRRSNTIIIGKEEREMSTAAMKITSKGQVTIPKEIRKLLRSDVVTFDVVQSNIVIRPVVDTSGSLSEYAKNVKKGFSFKKMKGRAWEEAVREKTGKKAS